jgi:hypothetical protein
MDTSQFHTMTLAYVNADVVIANGINATGDTVGQFLGTKTGNTHGFLLNGGVVTLVEYPGATSSFATGINDTVDIVGYYLMADTRWHGFLLSQGNFTTFDVPGATNTSANAINNAGAIAGHYKTPDNVWHGFRVGQGDFTNFTTFDVPGAICTYSGGINDTGDIVGYYYTADQRWHGFFLSQGNFTTFDVQNATNTICSGINATRDIVGYYQSPDTLWHGFGVSQGGFTNVTTFDVNTPGYSYSNTKAIAINAAGTIVGCVQQTPPGKILSFYTGVPGAAGWLPDTGQIPTGLVGTWLWSRPDPTSGSNPNTGEYNGYFSWVGLTLRADGTAELEQGQKETSWEGGFDSCHQTWVVNLSGTFAVHTTQLVFTGQGQFVNTDSCNPARNYQQPIPMTVYSFAPWEVAVTPTETDLWLFHTPWANQFADILLIKH